MPSNNTHYGTPILAIVQALKQPGMGGYNQDRVANVVLSNTIDLFDPLDPDEWFDTCHTIADELGLVLHRTASNFFYAEPKDQNAT